MPLFEQSIFLQIGVIVGVATILGFLARLIRQPLILAYIAAGIVLGPFGLKLITNATSVQTLSSLGVAFLLFLVGLELDYRKIKEVTKPALIVGLGQVIFTGLAGYLILRVLNFAPTASVYLALALTFSSTIIVVKLLSEKNELNSLSGRLTIGLLLVQDLIAIVALLILSGSLSPSILLKPDALLLATLKTIIFLLLVFLFNRLLLAKIFHQMARSSEILFLASLSWMFILAGLAFLFGFSVEIGAFIAGISLASLPYNLEIINRVKSLRDFFLTLFFVVLGVGLVFTGVLKAIPTIVYLSLFVIFGHALIVLILLGFLGFKKRISFLTALNSAQISEFSLILVALGLKLGHLNVLESSIISFVALITFLFSSYLIIYNHWIFHGLANVLSLFEKKRKLTGGANPTDGLPPPLKDHIVLFGSHRMGGKILRHIISLGKKIVVVDFNPAIVQRLISEKIMAVYGDMGEEEVREFAGVPKARLVISTVPTLEPNLSLLKGLKGKKNRPLVYLTAEKVDDALRLYEDGADYVILPQYLSAEHVFVLLRHLKNPAAAKESKKHAVKELKKHLAEERE